MEKEAKILSPKLIKIIHNSYWPDGSYVHWCPACKSEHCFAVENPFSNGHQWDFSGDVSNPSFTPSMNIKYGPYSDGRIERCHYFLTENKIQYCGDCTHELSGKTVPLPDIPEIHRIFKKFIPMG